MIKKDYAVIPVSRAESKYCNYESNDQIAQLLFIDRYQNNFDVTTLHYLLGNYQTQNRDKNFVAVP